MAKYDPLAEYLCAMLDKYIDDYVVTCQEHHRNVSLDDFKDYLNFAYKQGLPAKICETLASRFIHRNIA